MYFLFLLAICCNVQAQSKTNSRSKLYLKNNSVIYGTIVQKNAGTLTLQTQDSSRFVFNLSEVDSIGAEVLKTPGYRGFGHYTEIGALASAQNRPDNVTTAAFSFQTVNGYSFNRQLFAGLGLGADLYATQTIVPVFASIRGNLLNKGSFIPYYFIDGGYGINITSSTTDIQYKSGLMFASGIGFKVNLNGKSGFLVSFGYRLQKGATESYGVKTNFDYNRIALRAGFYL
jgi:hypothetical protein